MTCDVRWTELGDPALAALADVVSHARAADPLAPVTVVTPSPSVAVATRRALARRTGGTVGVGFHALEAVAEQLAAARLAELGLGAGVDRERVVTAVRVALAEAPGTFAPIIGHRVTWERIADAVMEIDGLTDAGLARVRSAGTVPAEVVRLGAVVRARLGPVGADTVVALAAEAAASGGPRMDALGTVVVHLPGTLPAAHLELLAALAARQPVVLLLGATGDPTVDGDLAAQFSGIAPTQPPAVEPAVPTAVISANDVEDEIRAAVRSLLALADAGTPLHRMALVHPSGPPYTRVVADVLTAAGVPFSGPSTRRLAQTVAGRVLLGVLEVDRSRFGRQEVVDLWATGVVVDDEGQPLPAAAFDERSRRLGVIRDAARWHETLDLDDARLRERATDQRAGTGEGDGPSWTERRLAQNAGVRDAVGTLEALCEARPATWPDVAAWAGQVLDRLCGPVRRRTWPDDELDADAAIRIALGRLAALDDLEPHPSVEVVRDTIRTVLDAPAPRPSRTGTGLLVTTVAAPPLVPLDAVAVVGLVEGHLPRVGGDDALLGDDLRRSVGLAGADDAQKRQRRAFLASLASAADHRIVSFARNDQRSGRTLVPSRWLVECVEARSAHRPDTEALMAGHHVDGVEVVPSHGAGLLAVADGDTAALHAEELGLAALVAAGGLDHPAAADPVLAAGAELLRGRRSGDFTRFDGNLDGDGVDVTALGVLSPTSLETYARCPRRWFFGQALGLRAMDRPEEIHRLPPRDRGTLAHRALERFFGEAIDAGAVPAPGTPWSDDARERLRVIADEECAAVESRGITGHPRWWEHDRAEIHRVLQRVLAFDDEQRAAQGTVPVAVELTFGRDGAPPLAVDLGDGRSILLAGQADRVDAGLTADGGTRMVVWDYKYSGQGDVKGLDRPEADGGDPLAGGTKLQLVAYGMAASASPELDRAGSGTGDVAVQAWYWFLKPPATNSIVGYAVGPDLRERFRRVLRVLADGIGSGRFPARPGEHQYHRGNFEHCAWCDFDPICPRDRDEEWERVRAHPSLAGLLGLTEEGSASVLSGPGKAP